MKKLFYILLFVPLALFGQDNYSLNFDYIDDYVLVEGNPTLDIDTISNVITISTFFKANEIELSELAGRMEESGPDGYRVNLRNNGDIWAQFGTYGSGETAIANNGYSVGEWIYVTAIFKNHEYVKIYTNGILKDSVSTNRSFGAFNTNLTIGRGSLNFNPLGNFELFSGYLDRIEQWNRELSVNEIQLYMTCVPIGDEEGLVGYWNFNEGTGDIVYDLSGNGNHGVINGATYSEDVPEQNCNELEGVNEELEEFSNLNQIDGLAYGGFLDGSYYFLSETPDTWLNSDSVCASLGGNLVIIETEAENQFIIDSLNISSPGIWLGLYQNINSENYSEPNGGWEWVNGLPLNFNNGIWSSYQNWNTGEPNHSNTNGETYANMWFQANSNEPSGTWNDWINTANWNDAPGVNNGINYVLEISAIYGCLDSDYYNYNPQANTSDNSCLSYEEFLIDSLQQALSMFETVEEVQDYSMSFDGVDDYINCGSNINISNSFSISSWVYVLPNGANYTIASKREMHQVGNSDYYNGFHFTLENDESGNGDDGLRFVIANNSQGDALKVISPIPYNQWNYVVGVFDAQSSIKLYINGSLADSINTNLTSIGSLANSQDLLIGAVGYSPGILSLNNYMDGHLNEATLWSFPLTQQQIQSYMTCPPTGQEEGLVGLWNFNEGSGDTVYDISGNGNHGIIYGGAEFSEDVSGSYKGCTDENALNFDESALCDNGSCVFADDVLSNLETENSNLEEELSVFETVEDEQDYSMSFDGRDDWLKIQNNLTNFNDQISMSCKIQFNSIPVDDQNSLHIINKYNTSNNGRSFALSYSKEGEENRLSLTLTNGDDQVDDWICYQIPFDSDSNKWYDIIVTYNMNNEIEERIRFYIDGDLIDQVYVINENAVHIGSNFSDIEIGRFYDEEHSVESDEFFEGNISNVLIWDTELSYQEIELYTICNLNIGYNGLVGYWNFNEGAGDTIYDLSGNENHGIIYGAEFSEDVPESYSGCTNANALNFDADALCDNGSCVFADAVVSNLEDSFNQTVSTLNNDLDSTNSTLNEVIDTWQSSIDLTTSTLDEVSLINQTLNSFNTAIDLSEGWNMIGYGCPEPVNIEQGMSMYTDLVLLIKDNNGSVYLPEFNFNGIGDFTPGFGYQLKISESIEGFSLCGDFTAIENTQITDIEDNNAQMQNDINCLTGNPEIGDHCYGGIVFYVDESGEHGLVANINDIDGVYEEIGDNNGYLWGCFDGQSTDVPFNIISTEIGYGEYNTNEIIEYCQEENIAAKLADSFEDNTYSDWYLPSLGELSILCHVYSENSNKFNYDSRGFWTSSYNLSSYSPYFIDFYNSTSPGIYNLNCSEHFHPHNTIRGVIPIRSF